MDFELHTWIDDLCGFPYQCHYQFIHDEIRYTVYIRWRDTDPWTVDLITDFCEQDEQWIELEVPFFTESQINEVKIAAIEAAKTHLNQK